MKVQPQHSIFFNSISTLTIREFYPFFQKTEFHSPKSSRKIEKEDGRSSLMRSKVTERREKMHMTMHRIH